MKRLVLAFASLLLACGPDAAPSASSPAASARGVAPPPPAEPAPVIDGAATQQVVSGVMVITKRTPGAELAAMQLYVRGGIRNWSAADAGIEELAVSTAASGGTRSLDKDALARKLASIGSDLGAMSTNDYAVFNAKALTANFDTTFGLLADAFLSPALPATELELQRQNMLAVLRHEQDDPDAHLARRAFQQFFKGHPYDNRAEGTAESVASLAGPAVAAHLGKLRDKSRLLLVVVGDVDPAHVATLARNAFGALPEGAFHDEPLPPPSFGKPALETEMAPLPTSYVLGLYPSAGFHDPDFFAAMVANQHLWYRISEEVRTKRNLSYAPAAGVSWTSAVPRGRLYVTAVDPDAAVRVMFDEVAKLKSTPISSKDLEGAKSAFATEHLLSSETSDGQAVWLARAQIYAGDFRWESKLVEHVKAVSAADIQAYANARIKNLQIEVVGPKKVDAKLFGSL